MLTGYNPVFFFLVFYQVLKFAGERLRPQLLSQNAEETFGYPCSF